MSFSMEKTVHTQEHSVIYDEVSRCVIHFSDGNKKIIINQNDDSLLAVQVVFYRAENPDFVEKVLKCYKPTLSVEELSAECGYYSVKTFTRHFKRSFNTTPKQWMLSIKQEKMMVYLKSTKYSLKDVASNLGFANVAHLSDFCLKRTGKRPEQIRKEL